MIELVIPGVPPSVNEYKKPNWARRCFYITPEAASFKRSVWYIARGHSVTGKRFRLDVRIFLGKGQRLDADNSQKCLMDALQESGMFDKKSDAAVKELHVYMDRDPLQPRTEVRIEAL